jgi:hypothetical protein
VNDYFQSKNNRGHLLAFTLFVLLSLFTLPRLISPVLNDIKADFFAYTLRNQHLPENTILSEIVSGCGNSNGSSNHTDIYVSMLIKSELPDMKIYDFYGQNRPSVPIDEIYWGRKFHVKKVDIDNKDTFAMRALNKNFTTLAKTQDFEGYYIVESTERAVSEFTSMFDLRGH